ncbi:MAG: chemotaxis protein CheA [Lachnospiraceae bacterium]|jgi:two-component system chemotaxis sensor kinase CheA|nr:chemotaxis protein CheA [Lachnospiraceae bacterium]
MGQEFSTDGMLDIFLFESTQLLEKLDELVIEKKDADAFDSDDINEIFRVMHTIKGSSGIMMFENIAKVSHKLEDIFYYIRESQPDNIPHMELVGHVLDVSGFISEELDKIKEGDNPDGDESGLLEELETFLKMIKKEIESDKKKEMPPENVYVAPSQFYIPPVSTEGSHFYKIHMTYKNDTLMSNVRAYSATYALKEVAEDLLFTPEDILTNEASADVILKDGFKMLLQAQCSKEEILGMIDSSEVEHIDIYECSAKEYQLGFDNNDAIIDLTSTVEEIEEKVAKEKKEPQPGDYVIKSQEVGKAKKLAKNEAKQPKQTFISINVEKMDMLMDLIGEIVIAEAVVAQNPDLKVPGLELSNFNKATAQLMKITSDLQDVIMSMRMMPLNPTFQKMNRIVFDSARKLGKEIDLVISGENTEVDKNIIENISDPLMHIIRNSVDHGIETKEDRIAAGKDPKGVIKLTAKNEGGKVLIIVEDDGQGLNKEKILAKARKNGLINKDIEYSDKEIFQFITLPGFSTKEKVTELSGRGVGMDVVVKNISNVGGTLEIDSEQGKGSTMTLKIPLTLAIITGIVLKIGSSTFVVETNAVKEFIRVSEGTVIENPTGDTAVRIRDEILPLVDLGKKYKIEGYEPNPEKDIMAVLEHEGKKICIYISSLIGEQEIVVKPIPDYFKKVQGISGCTQLGDGSVALILDVGGLT